MATRQAVWPQIRFLNPSTGFLLLSEGGAAGSEGVLLLRTTDGGAHWSLAANGTPTPQNPPIIFGGGKSGMGFSNAEHIWLTGTWAGNSILLYATHDGGATWQAPSLPVPSGLSVAGGAATSDPPQFFGSQDGVLPVVVFSAQTAVFYQTSDGGQTWTPTTPVHGYVYAVVDQNHIVATDGSTIYSTADGGLHWTALQPNKSLQGVTKLDFVSPSNGWAIVNGRLLRTTNGGSIWKKVDASTQN